MHTKIDEKQKLQNILNTVLWKTRVDCVLGASNKVKDVVKTNGNSWVQEYHHSHAQYFKKESVDKESLSITVFDGHAQVADQDWLLYMDKWITIGDAELKYSLRNRNYEKSINVRYKTDPEYRKVVNYLFEETLIAKNMRFGNCGTRCALIFNYLWQQGNPLIKRIQVFSMSYDHAIVIINNEGDTENPCGDNAFVIDPWYKKGIIYPISQFKEKVIEIKAYCNAQHEGLRQLGLESSDLCDLEKESEISWSLEYEIFTEKSPFHGHCSEDYQLHNVYLWDVFDDIDNLHEDHVVHFKYVLNDITSFWSAKDINALEVGLFSAVKDGNLAAVKFFLRKGVSINSQNNSEYTPLMLACALEHSNIIKYLVENGADVNTCSSKNNSALCIAVYLNSISLAEYLLKNDANPDIKIEKYTLVGFALKKGYQDLAKLLQKYIDDKMVISGPSID